MTGDDTVTPFQIDGLESRGRIVRMGPQIDKMLRGHNYPEVVGRLLAEVTCLTLLLGSSLKFEGKFILQVQSDGPVSLVVVDFRTPGNVRGYARFDEEQLGQLSDDQLADPMAMLGAGTIAMTIDQGPHTSRYQGIVALDGTSLEDVAQTYFAQSEQIPTRFKLAVAQHISRREDGTLNTSWRAGGVQLQFLPRSTVAQPARELPGDGSSVVAQLEEDIDDRWVEAASLLGTVQDDELTDPAISPKDLIFRLFNEHDQLVFEPVDVANVCSCSVESIEKVLASFSAEERAGCVEDGSIQVKCEFCGTSYSFDPKQF